MLLNADYNHPALVHAAELDWLPSPAAGIERRMLCRIGEEKAVATSLVRFAPGSVFPTHSHPGGEEFFVVEGTFEDENGHYPAGSYLRNPPGSRHTPASASGCVLFVRLWQFRPDDQQQVTIRPGESWPGELLFPDRRLLFINEYEQVFIDRWPAGHGRQIANPDGIELLVLDGSCVVEERLLQPMSWLRLPAGHDLYAHATDSSCRALIRLAPPAPEALRRLAE